MPTIISIEEFERRLRNVPRADLQLLVANAKRNANPDYAKLAQEVLHERFPLPTRRSGATPTTATFKGRAKHFSTGKDAYIWLLERFRHHKPRLLENQDR